MRWNRSTKLLSALFAIAAYFASAYWLKVSYVPPFSSNIEPKVAGVKVRLRKPFTRFLSDFGAIAPDESFAGLADSADNVYRSTIELYEDDRRLGPAHSTHADIGKIGHGRFSHWRDQGAIFVFSSSDNTDPQENARAYWAVKPDVPEP